PAPPALKNQHRTTRGTALRRTMRNPLLLRALMTVLRRLIVLRAMTAMAMTIIAMNLALRLVAHVATAPVAVTRAKTMPKTHRVMTLRTISRIPAMTRTMITEIPAIMMAITRDRSPTTATTAITVSAAAVTTTAATIATTVMTVTTTAVIIGEKAVVATMTTPATMIPAITTIVVTTAATIAGAITVIIAGAATITKMMTTVVGAAVVVVTVAAAVATKVVTRTTTCRFARAMNCRPLEASKRLWTTTSHSCAPRATARWAAMSLLTTTLFVAWACAQVMP